MSQSRRFSRIVVAVAAGLMAVVGAVPSGAAVVSTDQVAHAAPSPKTGPGDWCC
jgi:hypothetical protein